VPAPSEARRLAPAGAAGLNAARPQSFKRIRGLLGNARWRAMVARYVWWESAEEAEGYPERVLARVMCRGTFEDMQKAAEAVGDDILRDVLRSAQAGWFDEPAWHY